MFYRCNDTMKGYSPNIIALLAAFLLSLLLLAVANSAPTDSEETSKEIDSTENGKIHISNYFHCLQLFDIVCHGYESQTRKANIKHIDPGDNLQIADIRRDFGTNRKSNMVRFIAHPFVLKGIDKCPLNTPKINQ